MNSDSGEARKTAQPATSSGVPRRRYGVRRRTSSSLPAAASSRVASVRMNPGQMALTVIPCGPASTASWRVRLETPPFAAQ